MYSAPSVSYPVGRSHFQGWLIALTGLISCATGWLWHQQLALLGWRQGLFATVLIFSCLVTLRAWYNSPQGELRWDGQTWRWISGGTSICGVVTTHLDFQNLLLLDMHTTTGKRVWLWTERQSDMTRWYALRRAVFFRGSPVQIPDENSAPELPQVNL